MSDLEGLRRGYSDLHAAPPDEPTYEQPDDASTAEDMSQAWQQEAADESDHLYEPIGEKQTMMTSSNCFNDLVLTHFSFLAVTEEPEEEVRLFSSNIVYSSLYLTSNLLKLNYTL